MALEFVPLNSIDTKDFRKKVGFPVTKGLIYWYREGKNWNQCNVINYEVVETFHPSGSMNLLITLESGRQVNILSDYLADMQRTTFLSDVNDEKDSTNKLGKKKGERIEASPTSYVIVDLETTGTNHLIDEITEIGAIKYESGKETGRFNTLVKTDVEIPKKVEKLTGISNDMLRMFGVDPKEALESFNDFVGESVVIGHNFSTFDSLFLDEAFEKYLGFHFSNDYIDTLYLARKELPDLEHHSLESLASHYNIDYSKAHRAIEDCVINHLVYEYLSFGMILSEENVSNISPTPVKEEQGKINDSADDQLVETVSSEEWMGRISNIFPELIRKYGLLEDALSLMANIGKDNKITSYAICLYEPDLVEDRRNSSRNSVVARIKEESTKANPDGLVIYSLNPNLEHFGVASKESNGRYSVRISKNDSKLVNCILSCIEYTINNYVPKATGFACCSRYKECSLEKHCIHPNILFAKACAYRKNLENGKVYY